MLTVLCQREIFYINDGSTMNNPALIYIIKGFFNTGICVHLHTYVYLHTNTVTVCMFRQRRKYRLVLRYTNQIFTYITFSNLLEQIHRQAWDRINFLQHVLIPR